ncbi:MAG: hypothetical protein ISR65_09940 [Bacteriovoracaceae bacterium]|nr:hypothetical protein [Bacteriovoracaceae bacterium]
MLQVVVNYLGVVGVIVVFGAVLYWNYKNLRERENVKKQYLASLDLFSKNPYDLDAKARCYTVGNIYYKYHCVTDHDNNMLGNYGHYRYQVMNTDVRKYLIAKDINNYWKQFVAPSDLQKVEAKIAN